MGKALADFEQTDCERRIIHVNEMPTFRFVTEKATPRAFVTLSVYDEDSRKKKCDMKIQNYDGTDPREDMLKWLQSLISYFNTKEDMTVAGKFQTVSLCLSSTGSL